MSSKVQLNLEKRIPFLRDLEERGVFSKAEIAEIVKFLTKHEAALVRQGTQPRDVIEYAEYEQKLDRLRRIRVKRMKLATNPPSLSDYALSRHILSLYSRGTRRFAHSKILWQRYIAYTLEGDSVKAASNALTGAVAAFPHVAEFWIMAARWEADGDGQRGGGNMDGARKLIMRGLRFNKADASLWLEWLRLEIAFAERMRARWTTLGVLSESSSAKPPDETVRFDVDDEDEDAVSESLQEDIARRADLTEGDEAGKRALVNGALVDIVLQNSLKSCGVDDLARGLLSVLKSLPQSCIFRQRLIEQTYAHLSSLSSPSPATQVLLASRPYYELDAADPATALEALVAAASALQKLTSDEPTNADLRLHVMQFLVDRHAEAQHPEIAAFLAGHIARHWRAALKRNVATDALAKLRLSQLAADGVAEQHESMREVRSFLDAQWDELPQTLAGLEEASSRPQASLDDHLAYLVGLMQHGQASQVHIHLKRIQGRLKAEDARLLENRWASEMAA